MQDENYQKITKAVAQLHLSLSQEATESLGEFLRLLLKWNKAYNLTAIRSFEKMVTHHVLDSLAVVPFLHGTRILDVGTGAGFPGIPLALYFPLKHFFLLDSVGKKIRFLQQAQRHLNLDNVTPLVGRVEKFHTDSKFDVIISRAVGNSTEIMQASVHLIQPRGQWLFMKGMYPHEEIDQLRGHPLAHTIDVRQIDVPGLDAARHLVVVTHKEG